MAEQHAVGFAAGLARTGLKPVVAIYSTFLQRSYDQIFHDICLQNLNAIFMLDRSGLVGEDGPTHHGVFDIAYLRHLPNIVVMAPRDEEELKKMFRFAVSYNDGPVAIRYPRGASYTLPAKARPRSFSEINLSKSEILKEGRDLTIFSVGYMSNIALEAASLLSGHGTEAEVINARFIKPLDLEMVLDSVSKTKNLFTIEEGALNGGFGEFVLGSLINKMPKNTVIKNIGLPDRFIEHGKREILLDRCGLSSKRIKEEILSCLK
jgi:1-deoxy-D-xylulose-5-phosphate synthase